MNFGKALETMKAGNAVARKNWDGKTIAILNPGDNSKMSEPYIYEYRSDPEKSVPWVASHGELLADDWKEA